MSERDDLISKTAADLHDPNPLEASTKLLQDAQQLLKLDGQSPTQLQQDVARIASGAHMDASAVSAVLQNLGFPKFDLPTPQQAPESQQKDAPQHAPQAQQKDAPQHAPQAQQKDAPHQAPDAPANPRDAHNDAAHPIVLAGRQEAIKQANNHLGELVSVASMLPPGKFDVATAFATADQLHVSPETVLKGMGLNADAQSVAMLRNVQSIEKDANGHVTITQKQEQKLPLGVDSPGVKLNDVKLDKTVSFDLQPGSQHISNIHGISVEAHGGVPPRDLVSNLQNIDISKDAAGKTVVRAEASNPGNIFERIATGNMGEQIPVDIQMQDDGNVVGRQHGQQTTVAKI